MSIEHPRLIHVLTVADSLIFIDEQVRRARSRGYDVTVITSPDERLTRFGAQHGVRTVGLEMPRRVTPLGDWESVSRLCRLLERLKPDIVHAHTPKGGLLGSLAAHACGVPIRLYHMRGLPFLTQHGAMRALMQTTERLACASATLVICQSPSLRHVAIAERILPLEKATVVLGGSNGVDADERFNPVKHAGRRAALRDQWDIPSSALVIGFVGRLVRDKGVPELLRAFEEVAQAHAEAMLLVAGPLEDRDPIDERSRRLLATHPKVRCIGPTHDTPGIYAASDLVVLPSHREGFPNVPLEAASMELPVISTSVPGCIDAVCDGDTGLLVPVNDSKALAQAIATYLSDAQLRATHGRAGRVRVQQLFRRDAIADGVLDLYQAQLSTTLGGLAPPRNP